VGKGKFVLNLIGYKEKFIAKKEGYRCNPQI